MLGSICCSDWGLTNIIAKSWKIWILITTFWLSSFEFFSKSFFLSLCVYYLVTGNNFNMSAWCSSIQTSLQHESKWRAHIYIPSSFASLINFSVTSFPRECSNAQSLFKNQFVDITDLLSNQYMSMDAVLKVLHPCTNIHRMVFSILKVLMV